ncbi:hypothetical protein BDR05DRAFT_630505 [Suillus weaverae]|nr:hypothetical protein BDR05DRAFT_630505 [Suillus weaverae]
MTFPSQCFEPLGTMQSALVRRSRVHALNHYVTCVLSVAPRITLAMVLLGVSPICIALLEWSSYLGRNFQRNIWALLIGACC